MDVDTLNFEQKARLLNLAVVINALIEKDSTIPKEFAFSDLETITSYIQMITRINNITGDIYESIPEN